MDVDEEAGDSDDELETLVSNSKPTEIALEIQPVAGSKVGEWFVERAKFIPNNSTMDTPREYLSTAKTQRHDAAQSASCAYLRSKSAYTRTSPPRDTTLLLDDHDLC